MIYLGETQAKTLDFLKTCEHATYMELYRKFGVDARSLCSLVRKKLIIKEERFPCAVYKINEQRNNVEYTILKPKEFATLISNHIEQDYEKKMRTDEAFRTKARRFQD